MFGIEVLDEYKSHARIARQVFQYFGKRFEAAGGGSDTDDREFLAIVALLYSVF